MRLDHLLSKEHTPRRQANVLARMVVFTSGIVDARLVQLVCAGVRVLAAQRWLGVGSGTLLGPEGSAACSWWLSSCWAVSLVGLLGLLGLVVWRGGGWPGVWLVSLVPPFARCSLLWWVRGVGGVVV